ncbi:vitamin B12-dependent ribonucleotide reductase [Plakobranchus ocellatus]|uniref:Vitamin B12-dependent ribonucleotide reductase n=1 Tax=Plakobranchus ocellatus TaxID=259542 RepID=A0AAV3Z9S5_9GAST|nr:vitamin B12-dependent ribonucleotide reductase [Plakobranchus ocellatus]
MNHIKSFKGRSSHFSLKESRHIYLPEDLNASKMWRMFLEKRPEESICQESYRQIFIIKFKRSFGYPCKDTSPSCDSFRVEFEKPLAPGGKRATLAESSSPLQASSQHPLAINPKKSADLQYLKRFCLSTESRDFFSNLYSGQRTSGELASVSDHISEPGSEEDEEDD